MTIRHIAMVLEAGGLDGPEKLLLIAYCNRTDDHGYCWPGQQRLADDCGTSPATVKRVKKKLVEKGLIASKRRLSPITGEPISNLTRVNIELLAAMKRKPTDYDDNVIELITFAPDVPLPEKKRRAPKGSAQGADMVRVHNGPDPVDNPAVPSDLLTAQHEPDPAAKLSPAPGQDETDLPLKSSPAPGQDEPLTVSDPRPKPQGTVRPSVGSTDSRETDGGTDKGSIDEERSETPAAATAGARAWTTETTPGVDILIRMGQRVPRLALSGKVLMDQGRRLNEKIAAGWERQSLLDILSAPFTDEIRTSPGAVVSHRISALPTNPHRAARWLPEATAGDTLPAAPDGERRRDPVAAAAWTWAEKHAQVEAAAAGRGVTRCCQGGDGFCERLAEAGHDECGHHLGWAVCEGGCGVALPPEVGATCVTCSESEAYQEMVQRRAERPPAHPCPGLQGRGCERSGEVQTTTGLCFRCEVTAAAERKRVVDAEWAATVDQVKEAVVASENAGTPY